MKKRLKSIFHLENSPAKVEKYGFDQKTKNAKYAKNKEDERQTNKLQEDK